MERYPLRFQPVLLDKVWGGDRLGRLYPAKGVVPGAVVGESWELCGRGDHPSVVANGVYAGRTLADLAASAPDVFVGRRALEAGQGRFPLLYKFLDAAQNLSVQVHPDDAYALAHADDLGKMECWYILDAAPGAQIVKGLRRGAGRADFERLLAEQKVEACLNLFSVRPGDVVFLPPRTLHAIGAGLVLFEIQQSSDVTYRAYDWGRTGLDGKPRELHLDRVLDVTEFGSPAADTEPVDRSVPGPVRLAACPYFVLEEYTDADPFGIDVAADRFTALTVIEGAGRADETVFEAGTTLLFPAGAVYRIQPAGRCRFLVSYVPPLYDWKLP